MGGIEILEIEWILLRGSLRLLILALLQKSMMTGYQILKTIQQLIDKKPSLSTIHDILTELENKKLIESFITQQSEKYYRITELGEKILMEVKDKSMKKVMDVMNVIFGKQSIRNNI
ncbi:MAG: PadR family transcriptional regulator [Candidatus Methanomethylicia archaeon]|nr:PadR family transcriptional regulator [Candidatus Methanomethylicia archaeon]